MDNLKLEIAKKISNKFKMPVYVDRINGKQDFPSFFVKSNGENLSFLVGDRGLIEEEIQVYYYLTNDLVNTREKLEEMAKVLQGILEEISYENKEFPSRKNIFYAKKIDWKIEQNELEISALYSWECKKEEVFLNPFMKNVDFNQKIKLSFEK